MDLLLSQLASVSADCLCKELQDCLLIDIRPSSQHCSSHIQLSENINFTNILLRRLMKGVVKLDAHISSQDLIDKLTQRKPTTTKLVLYDACSKEGNVKSEILKHAEVLYKTSHSTCTRVYYLDGGFNEFSKLYPDLCEATLNPTSHIPIGISVSASLPINFARPSNRQKMRAQTPLEDEASRFGPPVEILPFLALGCARASGDLGLLRKLGVTAVLNVSHNCASHFEELFEYKIIPVQDSHQSDLLSQLDTAFEFIDSIKAKGGKVLVHCHAGISRSATVCIAYIMKQMETCLTKAYDFVKQKRPCISPNLHFMGQLLEFERRLQEASPNKDSPLFFEEPTPMDVDSIPVSISTKTTLQKSKPTNAFQLRLPIKKQTKSHFKRSFHFVSAPSSIDIPESSSTVVMPELPIDVSEPMESSKVTKTSSNPPAYNYTLMGQYYSSTDGSIYKVKSTHIQTGSLPATPVDGLLRDPIPNSCRTQLNNTPMNIQLSPCRVVACNGCQYV